MRESVAGYNFRSSAAQAGRPAQDTKEALPRKQARDYHQELAIASENPSPPPGNGQKLAPQLPPAREERLPQANKRAWR